MRSFSIIIILLVSFTVANAQTGTDTLVGKWKFSLIIQKRGSDPMQYEKYVSGLVPPRFEYVEFNDQGVCTYNEETKDDTNTEYSFKSHQLTLGGITYKVKFEDKENMKLSRTLYTYTDETGKKILVKKEEISFKRIF